MALGKGGETGRGVYSCAATSSSHDARMQRSALAARWAPKDAEEGRALPMARRKGTLVRSSKSGKESSKASKWIRH